MAPSMPMVKPLLRTMARAASAKPMETIVVAFCLTTYAYFLLLQAVKHSAFLSPASPYNDLKPAYAIHRPGEEGWSPATEEVWSTTEWTKVDLQQVVVAIDSPPSRPGLSRRPQPVSVHDLSHPSIHPALSNFTSYMTSSGYPALCYPSPNECISSTPLPTSPTRSVTFSLAFRPPPSNRDKWASGMAGRLYTSGETKFVVGRREQRIDRMQSATWVGYACRALVMRFWDLAMNADSADIFVVLIGYLVMHSVFINLYLKGRQLGSHFWLATTTLISSVFAFVLSVPISLLLGIAFDPVGLSEAIPFLVITVGFDKPLRLARTVFSHPALYTANPSSSLKGLGTKNKNGRMAFKPASEVVQDAVDSVGEGIVRDYAIEVVVLAVGAVSGVGGLKEFCALAALILIADCVMLFTFYVALLNVFVEVRRVKVIRKTMKHQPSTELENIAPTTSTLAPPERSASRGSLSPIEKEKDVFDPKANPKSRLKLILIVAFLALHILNLCTTLTPAVALNRFISYPSQQPAETSVDIASRTLQPILAQLALTSTDAPLIVRVTSPLYVRVVPAPSAHKVYPHTPNQVLDGEEAMLDSFMSEWTNLVGDSILSKWIVLTLAVSVFLNGYLLKGLGASTTPIQQAVQFAPPSTAPSVNTSPKKRSMFSLGGGEEKDANGRDGTLTPAEVYHMQRIKETKLGRIDLSALRRINSGSWESGGNTPLNLGAQTPVSVMESPVLSPSLGLTTVESPKQEKKESPKKVVPAPIVTNTTALAPAHVIAEPVALKPTAFGHGMMTPLGTPKGTEASIGRRSFEDCLDVFENEGILALNDEEIILLGQRGKVAAYALEKLLGDYTRAVKIRRALISRASATKTLESSLIPMNDYNYNEVFGACCENVVGFIPLPLGIAGPLNIDGESMHIPMATAEGTLVASTSRGCKALNAGGGVTTVLTKDAMTRGPAIEFPNLTSAAQVKRWIDSPEGSAILRDAFDSTSRFARLQGLKCGLAGRTLYVRFASSTGDAMGMNMISKGVEKALTVMAEHFPQMSVLALSGNYCMDKKPNAMNWIEGRGKSVVAEAVVPGKIVKSVLKTTVHDLCNLNIKKNLVGSSMAGSIGGFNAHAANILTAMFLATGQDPAQNVVSSNCMTLMEPTNNGEDLLITVSMPSIEVGTVGGGTILSPQRGVLEMLGLAGAHPTSPGHNARRLARVIAAAVMAGELSLMSALAAGHLIKAHMAHNRSQPSTPLPTRPGTPAGFAQFDKIAAAEEAAAQEREKRKENAPTTGE